MIKTKLIRTLKTFSEKEFAEFGSFLLSPYFHSGRDLMPLYGTLKKFHPSFDNREFTRENIIKILYPNRSFDKRAYHLLGLLMSEMYNEAEKYLFQKASELNIYEYYSKTAKEFTDRGLYEISLKLINKGLKELNESEYDLEYFGNFRSLWNAKYNYAYYKMDFKTEIEYIRNLNINHILEFLITAANHSEILYASKGNTNTDFEPNLIDVLISNLNIEKLIIESEQLNFDNFDLLKIYLFLIQLQRNRDNEDYYRQFREQYKKVSHKLSRTENRSMHLILLYSANYLRTHNYRKYTAEYFEIIKDVVRNKFYSPDGREYMHIISFRNYFIVALQMGEFEWAENFIKDHIHMIDVEQRTLMLKFALSNLHFFKKEYTQAISLISKIKNETFFYKWDIKILSLKIYYEAGYSEELFSMMDSYRHFLIKSKIVFGLKKKRHLNFINFLSMLEKSKYSVNGSKLEILEEKVSETEDIVDRIWILDKVKELKEKNLKY